MPFIDIRAPISFRYINTMLLDVAEHPENYSELAYRHVRVAPGIHPSHHPMAPAVFVEMARQACATIIVNCAAELWSVLGACLLALEPSNQMTEDVRSFLKKERIGNLRFFEHYFKVCGEKFLGTQLNDDVNLIYDLRDAIVHDQPDRGNAAIDEQMDILIARLRPRLKESDLRWLPKIPTLYPTGHPVTSSSSQIAVMNLMRYPVAKWVVEATDRIGSHIDHMMSKHTGGKHLTDDLFIQCVSSSLDVPLSQHLRIGGISQQIE